MSRLTKFFHLIAYRDVQDSFADDHFYSCLTLSELSHKLHVKYGTSPDSQLWAVFYDNRCLNLLKEYLNVSINQLSSK